MQDVDVVTLVLRWIHILAAMASFGGALYMRFALMPAAQESLDSSAADKLREAARGRWARFVHGAIAVLLVTGVVNIARFSMSSNLPAMPYHAILGVKFLLAIVVFFVATVVVGKSAAFEQARRNMGGWLNALIAATVIIVLLSGILSQVRHARTAPGEATASAPLVDG